MIKPVVNLGDILVRGTTGTRFGGTDDTQDNGLGAWGFDIRNHPHMLLCALPMRTKTAGLDNSPLPYIAGLDENMTRYVVVRVYSKKTKHQIDCLLADIGPAGNLGRGIDLSNSVVKALNLSLDDGIYDIDYRILGWGWALTALNALNL